MLSIFKRSKKETENKLQERVDNFSFLECDMHSHLVPGIDDGAQSLEESVTMVRDLVGKGYKKLIVTPHVQGDFYQNTTAIIQDGLQTLKQGLKDAGIDIPVSASAEYFLDNYFLKEVLPHGLVTFGDNQVLVEVSMAGWPRNFSEILFEVQALGYKPILAHPERYLFEDKVQVFSALKEKGVQMQLNLLSVSGYYGRTVKQNAETYLEHRLYDYCGTDLHHQRHLTNISRLISDHQEMMLRLKQYGFLNHTL